MTVKANIKDYENKDFIRIENGSIVWQGYFYNDGSGCWVSLEYIGFETTINDYINKYNRSSVNAYDSEGTGWPQYIVDETERDIKAMFDEWMEGTLPIKAEDINEDTLNGFYVIM